ncbi:MAG: hypothetical protein ACR2ID_10745 [Chthoniobacterales bacterium]
MKPPTPAIHRSSALAATLLLLAAATGIAEDLPKGQSFARYDPMLNRSPFAVASAPAAAPAATPNFAKDLYVANVARTPAGDLVTIASSADKNFKKYLSTTAPEDGYSVSDIEWSERIGASKVTISKDGQFASLGFNQAVLSQPIAGAPVQIPGQPPQIPQPQTAVIGAGAYPNPAAVPANVQDVVQPAIKPAPIPSLPVPSLPTPPPRTRGVIQRNPDMKQAPQQNVRDN